MQKKENLGIADRLNSLYQKEIELVTEQQVVSLKVNEIIAMISLYQALGGISFFNAETLVKKTTSLNYLQIANHQHFLIADNRQYCVLLRTL